MVKGIILNEIKWTYINLTDKSVKPTKIIKNE